MSNDDPQAKRLYDMEDAFMRASLRARCTRDELQALADKACRRWRVPLAEVVFSRGTYWYGMYYPYEQKIRLFDAPKRKRFGHGRNPGVLLHEVAHHIDDCIWSSDESHGPVFCAIVMDLYDHYGVLPAKAFRLLARENKIKIARLRKRKPA